MFYEEYGNRLKPTIIFLHGAMAFQSFSRQIELADNFHLIFYTLPGHGLDSDREFDRQTAIEEVVNIVKGLDKKPVHLVGFSLGAQLVLQILNDYENLFDKAVIISPLIDSNGKDDRKLHISTRLVGFTTKFPPLSRIVGKYIGIEERNYHQFIREQKNQKVNNLAVNILKNMLKSDDVKNITNINNPVLVLVGGYEVSSFVSTAKKLAAVMKNAKLDIYKTAGHNIPYKFYKKFNMQIRDFLSY